MKFSLPAVFSRRTFVVPVERSGHQVMAGFIPDEWGWNWWQRGHNSIRQNSHSAIVAACVSAYAQTTAMCPGTHWRHKANNGRERVTASALTRILRQPNTYQTISDFLLNLVRELYQDGNAYVLIQRNARFEPQAVYLMRSNVSRARVAPTGDVFYSLGGNEVIERMIEKEVLSYVPARDVIHIRLETPRNALIGEPPLISVNVEVAAAHALLSQTLAFVNREARPSIVLATDQTPNREQMQLLRQRWDEQTQKWNAGGTPILSNGLKPIPITTTSRDAQLAEILGATDQRIAAAYRVPLAIVGLMMGVGPQGSTESLMQFWVASGFGFALNHIEEAFGLAFGLRGWPDEYLEFDTEALLRSNFRDRVEGLVRGIGGGLYAANEARAKEELPAVQYGDEPRVQQQDVPLSAWYSSQPDPNLAPPAKPALPAPAAEIPPTPPAPPPKDTNNATIGSAAFAERVYAAINRHDRSSELVD